MWDTAAERSTLGAPEGTSVGPGGPFSDPVRLQTLSSPNWERRWTDRRVLLLKRGPNGGPED